MNVAQISFGLMELRAFSGSKGPSITRHCSIVPVRELALKSVLPEATNKGRREEGRPLLVGRLGRFPFGRCPLSEIRLSSFFSADRSQMRSMG